MTKKTTGHNAERPSDLYGFRFLSSDQELVLQLVLSYEYTLNTPFFLCHG